jgi:hypothetical protein
MATSYSNKGSSLAQRVSTQFEQEFGRPANAGGVIDPQFAAWSTGAMAKLQADDKAALERTQRNWNRVRNTAYVAAAVPFAAAALPAIAGTAATSTLPSTSLIPGALATPGAGTAAAILPSTSLIPGALATPGGGTAMGYGKTALAATGIKAATDLYGAKKGADSNTKSADMQTRAATEAAKIQAQSSADQLKYIKRQSELDRLSKRFTDQQNYGLSSAGVMNDFTRYGDTSFNTRASELSQGRTQDKIYGGRQNQMNYMRNLLGMPQNELSVYVEPEALQLTRPTLPAYVEDTTPIE